MPSNFQRFPRPNCVHECVLLMVILCNAYTKFRWNNSCIIPTMVFMNNGICYLHYQWSNVISDRTKRVTRFQRIQVKPSRVADQGKVKTRYMHNATYSIHLFFVEIKSYLYAFTAIIGIVNSVSVYH
jgi:hypothetical protein